jgi:predicted nucleotide-binding protein
MKSRVESITAVIATIVSLLAAIIALAKWLGLGAELSVALITVVITLIVGVFANVVADSIKSTRILPFSRRVFVSYPYDAEEVATKVIAALRQAGAQVWVFNERVHAGDDIQSAVQKGIADADSFVVLLTHSPSRNQQYELGLAQARGLKIIPVVLEPTEIPSDLARLRYVDYRRNPEKALGEIVKAAT